MDQQIGNELPPLHNPEQNNQPPQDSFEMAGMAGQTEVQASVAIERGISQNPLAPPAQMPMPSAGIPTQNPPVQSQPLASGTPAMADDTDLIEKEWVVKAKEIVARTKHDPYQQNKEVERVKADYLKKRYNKDVKVTED
jgi:hypothetical protein